MASIYSRGECLAPTDPRVLGNPLDFFAEDHLRERQICALLDRMAAQERIDPDALFSVLGFLDKELPLHLQDEDEDLFPLLRRRCEEEDAIDEVIDKLQSDHTHAYVDASRVLEILEAALAGNAAVSESEAGELGNFATRARRHLIVENAIILPIARARLTDADLDTLRLRMLQRRGLDRVLSDDPPA